MRPSMCPVQAVIYFDVLRQFGNSFIIDIIDRNILFHLIYKIVLLGFTGILGIVFDSGHSSQQSLLWIRLYDCSFPPNSLIDFKLYGLMSLIRCEFKGNGFISLYLEKSRYEPEITEETLRNFTSKDDQNMIEIIQTKIYGTGLFIYINNAARRLKMENVELDVYFSHIHIAEKGNDCQTVSVFELEMINCRMSIKLRKIYLHLKNSFAKFRFENTVFESISLLSEEHAGLASYVFDNCTFTHAFHFDIERFVDFNISGSSIFVPNDCEGIECNVHLTGVNYLNLVSDRELSKMYFFMNETDLLYNVFFKFLNKNIKRVGTFSIVDIESTSFQGGQGPFFTIRQASLRLFETVFHIQSHRTRPKNLIEIQYYFTLKDVLINFTSTDRDLQQVNIMSLLPGSLA